MVMKFFQNKKMKILKAYSSVYLHYKGVSKYYFGTNNFTRLYLEQEHQLQQGFFQFLVEIENTNKQYGQKILRRRQLEMRMFRSSFHRFFFLFVIFFLILIN